MDWNALWKKLIFPPKWLMAVLTAASAAALILIFVRGLAETPIAYGVYVVAFYTLCVVAVFFSGVLPRRYQQLRRKIYDHPLGRRWLTDVEFRTQGMLYLSLGINLLYAAVNLFIGFWYRSVWSFTLGVYYVILGVMRFLLLWYVRQTGFGKDRVRELRRARLCGSILMTLNLALSGVVVLVILQNESFEYAGILIYVMAMYTFYMTFNAVRNLLKYRKYNSPILSTAKAVSLAAALVSMLSLETAMLSQFGEENTSPHFNQIMVGATGAGVCAIVVAMAAYIIITTSRELAQQ